MLKKVHILRLRKAAGYNLIPFSEIHRGFNTELPEIRLILAEFMDFFSMFDFCQAPALSEDTERKTCPFPDNHVESGSSPAAKGSPSRLIRLHPRQKS